MTDLFAFVNDLVQETGEILLNLYHDPQTQSRIKADYTLLTDADLAANEHITASIRRQFPNDHILSEEQETRDPETPGPTWVVDPLDGTTNFSLGVHYWGVSVARILDGWPQVAGLSFPVFKETYMARRGEGAYLNAVPLRLAPETAQPPVSLFTCDSRTFRRYQVKLRQKPRILGSAAYNFCSIARGVSLLGFESRPHIWDIAGSWLVLEEAGGFLRSWQKQPFPMRPGKDYRKTTFPTLGAARQDGIDLATQHITPR